MRLLLLNINYLRHHFFYQNHAQKIMDFEHPTCKGKSVINMAPLLSKIFIRFNASALTGRH